MATPKDYSRSVFVNCPFDTDYQKLFEAIVFTIYSCGFIPKTAKEKMDSDEVRIRKIISLIKNSKFGIHDLSRANISNDSANPRYNMPLELGIFIGCKRFGDSIHKSKKYLIIDKEKYKYQTFISDISGQDIREHKNKPEKIIQIIRDWLITNTHKSIPGLRFHKERFKKFKRELKKQCEKYHWDYDKLTFHEYCRLIVEFIREEHLKWLES